MAVLATRESLFSFQTHDKMAEPLIPPLADVRYDNMTCFGQVSVTDVTSREIAEKQWIAFPSVDAHGGSWASGSQVEEDVE